LLPCTCRPAALQARFAKWGPIFALQPSALDYSSDGIMVSPTAGLFGEGVYHYVRALAHASAAAHTTGEGRGNTQSATALTHAYVYVQ
jgi:hypothetical protein